MADIAYGDASTLYAAGWGECSNYMLEAGPHDVRWNGTDRRGTRVASGIYYYRLEANNRTATRKMVVLK